MKMKCPHCGKENKITARFVFVEKCFWCGKQVHKNLNNKFYNLRFLGWCIAFLPIWLDDSKLLSIRGGFMMLVTLLLMMCIEVIFMKLAYRLNQN